MEAAAAEATARLNKRRVVGQRKGQPPEALFESLAAAASELSNGLRLIPRTLLTAQIGLHSRDSRLSPGLSSHKQIAKRIAFK